MKLLSWHWLLLSLLPAGLFAPGCLLIQPLDEAKSDANAAGNGSGGASHAGSGSAGRATTSGGATSGGAPSGGAPSGVDFSLFTGTWQVTGGSRTINCGGTMMTQAVTGSDLFALGTTSDLIWDPAAACPLLADVSDRVASGQPGQMCTSNDGTYSYEVYLDSFDFEVLADGTAKSALSTSTFVTETSTGAATTCLSDDMVQYKR